MTELEFLKMKNEVEEEYILELEMAQPFYWTKKIVTTLFLITTAITLLDWMVK